ncbi:A/B/D/E cyclin [Hypoxylon sp. FL1284]|nr:A/B/D/E cyclin [Hypoxylon sp. FL1284]
MPPGRPAGRRVVSNENDENSTRMTRAKAAALDVDVTSQPAKQALQSKKSAANVNPTAQRKRAALDDVSNVGKGQVAEGKKPLGGGKVGLVSKAAHPTGVQKSQARPTSRTALSTKDPKKAEPKRTASGSGVMGTSHKRKVTSTNIKQDIAEDEPLRKKAHTLEKSHPLENEHKKLKQAEPKSSKLDSIAEQKSHEESPKNDVGFVLPPGVKDLEEEGLDDPVMAAEYAHEIFEYLRDLECNSIPNPQYMAAQDELEWKTRGILVDWMIEVHTRFHLLPETLFLAINIIDRFLSQKVVQLDRVQLVGITAMFIAAKYEEVLSPHVSNYRHVADDGFSDAEILSAERFILETLNYDLSYPNPMNFLRRISKADDYDIQSRTIGKFLMEISIVDYRFLAYRPSHVAAAAMYLARMILDRGEWDPTIAYYAGYSEEEIEPVFELMVDYLARPICHEAFYKKYASKKFMKASLITRSWAKKNAPVFGIVDTKESVDDLSLLD